MKTVHEKLTDLFTFLSIIAVEGFLLSFFFTMDYGIFIHIVSIASAQFNFVPVKYMAAMVNYCLTNYKLNLNSHELSHLLA